MTSCGRKPESDAAARLSLGRYVRSNAGGHDVGPRLALTEVGSEEKYENIQTVLVLAGGGCHRDSGRVLNEVHEAADVSGGIRTSLDQAGLKDVSVTEDHDKGVVTLGGHVAADADKVASPIHREIHGGAQVVSNQIEVIPPGAEHDAKKIDSDLDKGIEGNLDAALLQGGLHKNVNYAVKNQVVTMTGEVDSQSKRTQA